MAKFKAGDIICHKQNNKKWLISRISDGNYYLKGLDRRTYITLTADDLAYFYVIVKGKRIAKAIYG